MKEVNSWEFRDRPMSIAKSSAIVDVVHTALYTKNQVIHFGIFGSFVLNKIPCNLSISRFKCWFSRHRCKETLTMSISLILCDWFPGLTGPLSVNVNCCKEKIIESMLDNNNFDRFYTLNSGTIIDKNKVCQIQFDLCVYIFSGCCSRLC